MTRKINVVMFNYSGQPHLPVVNSLLTEFGLIAAQRGWGIQLSTHPGDCMLPRARNAAVSNFLATDCTDLIMIDDDNHCEAGGFMAMLDAPVDVVGLPCRSRNENLTWPIRWLNNADMQRDPVTGLVEVDSVGTGIIKFSRSCLERIVATFEAENNWYHCPFSHATGKAWPLFQYEIANHRWWGEDHYFRMRWQQLGGKIWVNPDVQTFHYGIHGFAGKLADWLAAQPANIEIDDIGKGIKSIVQNKFSQQIPIKIGPALHQVWPQLVTERAGKVAVCIASRGRPLFLNTTVETILEHADLPHTRIVVGLDKDDLDTMEPYLNGQMTALNDPRVIVSIEDREDTLGAKYNRCQSKVDADLYVIGVDMVGFVTPEWDRVLRDSAGMFEDGIGAVWFGQQNGPFDLPNMIALTKGLIDKMNGQFCTEHFPFWWHDTWASEIAQMIGRSVWADVKLTPVPPKKTRGAREIVFWGEFFNQTRTLREAIATKIIGHTDFAASTWQRVKLLQELPALSAILSSREASTTRNAQWAEQYEKQHGFDAQPDDRYARVKARAVEFLASMNESTQAAA